MTKPKEEEISIESKKNKHTSPSPDVKDQSPKLSVNDFEFNNMNEVCFITQEKFTLKRPPIVSQKSVPPSDEKPRINVMNRRTRMGFLSSVRTGSDFLDSES